MKFSRFDNQQHNKRLMKAFLSYEAFIALSRPQVCPCSAYAWLHRKGVGACGRPAGAGGKTLDADALIKAVKSVAWFDCRSNKEAQE